MLNNIDCTVIIPLKDNPSRTVFTLENSIFPEIQYIFADGSKNDSNQMLFSRLNYSNVSYFRFPFDKTQRLYSKKMLEVCASIKTKYCFTLDQGDLLSLEGVIKSVRILEKNPKISAACGRIYTGHRIGIFLWDLQQVNQNDHLSDIESHIALSSLGIKYGVLWYSVMLTEYFTEIRRDIFNYNLNHPYMEIYPTIFLLSKGKFISHGSSQILRITYSPSQTTEQDASFSDPNELANFEKDAINFGKVCNELLGITPSLAIDAVLPLLRVVKRQRERQWLGPSFISKLMPSNATITKLPRLRDLESRANYYFKLVFKDNARDAWFSGLRISRLKNWSSEGSHD